MRRMWLLVLVVAACGSDKAPAPSGSASAQVTATPLPPATKPIPYDRPAGPEGPPLDDPPPPEEEDDDDDDAIAAPPPPPPPPPPGRNFRPPDIVQPQRIDKQRLPDDDDVDLDDGEEGGVAGGVVGGVVGTAPPPPPPPPPSTQNVPPTMLESHRIAGNKLIVPDDATKTAIEQSGKHRILGSFKLCITSRGDVDRVTSLKSTGFPAYDTKILTEMRAWRYRPYLVNGTAVPVCTAVTFIYQQQ